MVVVLPDRYLLRLVGVSLLAAFSSSVEAGTVERAMEYKQMDSRRCMVVSFRGAERSAIGHRKRPRKVQRLLLVSGRVVFPLVVSSNTRDMQANT